MNQEFALGALIAIVASLWRIASALDGVAKAIKTR